VARFLDARAKTNFKFAISEGVIVRKAGDTPAATVQNKSAPPWWRGALNFKLSC